MSGEHGIRRDGPARTAADIAARMEQVVGQPPRLDAPGDEAMGAHGRDLIERMRQHVPFPRNDTVHPFFATLALQPRFFEAFMQLGMTVMGSASLGARERELIILRTGWLLGAPYQFGEHVAQARQMGFTAEDFARIKQGSSADGWEPLERALLKAAEELHADAMISDETWAELAARLDPSELIELPMIVGHYTLTAFVQNALRIGLNAHNPGLTAG